MNSNDYCDSLGSIDSDEQSCQAHTANTKAAGTVPATGSSSHDYCDSYGSIESDEHPATPTPPPPRLRGLSPPQGRSVTTIAILTVRSSLTNILSHPHRHRHHQAAGTVPVKGSSSDDFCDSYDSIESDENPATPAPPRPRLRGVSPRRGRAVTTIAILTVLSSLTNILPPPHRHRQGCGDCPRRGVEY
ncbi:MAG UNVERIFIED_CONTAM: hypothetical protein LVR18_12495 [Planctomycetaceae bacterium]